MISLQLTADIYDRVEEDIKRMGLKSDCIGGGRIQHDKSEKKILVYGYSMVSRIFKKQKQQYKKKSIWKMFYRQIFHSTLAKVIQAGSWGGFTKQWNIITMFEIKS